MKRFFLLLLTLIFFGNKTTYSQTIADTCGVFYYNYNITPVSCAGACDGMIQITGLTGGTPSYTYLWDDPASQSSSTATNLCTGNYSVTFTDGVGNTCIANYFVPSVPPINYSLIVDSVSCAGGSNGSICFTGITGGTPPYTYDWPTGSTGFSCYYGLPVGAYSICVTDANGCQSCTTAVVWEPLPIEINFTTTNVSCFGECDGNICSSVTGGSGAYTYLWSPGGATTTCFSFACAGNSDLCVTDATGCMVCSTAVITEPALLTMSTIITDASCSTCCDGDIQINPSGGTAPYTFTYSPGPTPVPNNFCSDEYYFCVTDANGCETCDTATVSFATAISELNNNQITIFPNPNNGDFLIENFISEVEIKITDVNGKIVFNKVVQPINQKLVINTNMGNGIYFMHFRNVSTNQIDVKKIIIQK